MDVTNSSIALLIDADNTSLYIIPKLLTEVTKYGTPHIKRTYGDWSTPQLKEWKPILLEYAIQPIQQFAYITGKNTTDSALIIDTMDLLYTYPYLTTYCIVSSDSDFTRLALRLREAGKHVLGFGKQTTPQPFKAACNQFIYTEAFNPSNLIIKEVPPKNAPLTKDNITQDKELLTLFQKAFELATNEKGIANLSIIKKHLCQINETFNHKNYGYSKFSELIEDSQLFELVNRKTAVKLKSAPLDKNLIKQLKTAYNLAIKDNQLPYISAIKAKLHTDFNHKIYGYKNFSALLKDTNLFQINNNNQAKLIAPS